MKKSILKKFADKFNVEADKLLETLKKTVFKLKDDQEVTNEQMISLLIVADQYNLNPFTREIIAFVDKGGGVVPGVTVDGWCRIINNHPQFDGVEFRYSDEIVELEDARPCPAWCEATIFRKDRNHPTRIQEFLDEVYRPRFEIQKNGRKIKVGGPWQSHTKRMLRHKALIQCARVAFGFSGIYDEDEAIQMVQAKDKEVMLGGNEMPGALPQSGVIIDMPQSQPKPEKIPVALLKQIEIRAKQQGKEVPEFKNREEAQKFLNELLQKKNGPKAAASEVVVEAEEAEVEELW